MPTESSSPWISTADRLPPDDDAWVLIYSTESGFGIESPDDIDATVTHWMPIPPLPSSTELSAND